MSTQLLVQYLYCTSTVLQIPLELKREFEVVCLYGKPHRFYDEKVCLNGKSHSFLVLIGFVGGVLKIKERCTELIIISTSLVIFQ